MGLEKFSVVDPCRPRQLFDDAQRPGPSAFDPAGYRIALSPVSGFHDRPKITGAKNGTAIRHPAYFLR